MSFISFLHNVILPKAVSAQPRVVAYCSMGGGMYVFCEMQEYFKLEFVLKVDFLNTLKIVLYKWIHSDGHDLFNHIK